MWRLVARSSHFLPPFVFYFCFFLRLYSVRAAIDSDTRCSYSRSHAVQQTNLQLHTRIVACVSFMYVMLIQQSTGIVIRGMTAALSFAACLRKYYRLTDVPLVCAYAHCYTISRKVLANSAMNRTEIILRENSICSFEGIQHARVLVSYISIKPVRTFSLRCLFHLIIFLPSSKTVPLRCSFCLHIDSNRATPHASTESRLSASREIRSIRIAITVPCP